ncbi:MAG TPA: polysaccharide biosynthesis C-terminal domain-containing protein [Puia sp.]|nr:polysaccharide biosynthesis C-terminal domain-containing protein [Puia sp.]
MSFANVLYKSFYWRAIQTGSSFALNILLARMLQSAGSAEFYSLLYWSGLVTSFFTFGLDIGLNYFVTRGQLSISAARRIILGITALALIAGTGLLFALHSWIPHSGLSLGTMLFFVVCQIAGILLSTLAGTVFTAVGRNHEPVRLAAYGNVGLILLAVADYCFFAGGQALQQLYILYGLVSLFQGLLVVTLMNRLPAVTHTPKDGPVGTVYLLRFSFFLFVVNFLFFIGARIGIYLLPYNTSPAALGNYIQVYKLVEYLGLGTSFLYFPFVTLAAGDDGHGSQKKVLLLVRLSNTLVLVVCSLGAALGYFLFPAIFGPSYGAMYPVFLAFIPGIFGLCSSSFFTAWFFGTGHIRYNFISALVQLVTALSLFFVLTPHWGIQGAALAYSAGAVASFVYDAAGFSRFCRVRPREMLLITPADLQLLWNFSAKLLKTSGGSAR